MKKIIIILILLAISITAGFTTLYFYKNRFTLNTVKEIKINSVTDEAHTLNVKDDIKHILDSFNSAESKDIPSVDNLINYSIEVVNKSNNTMEKTLTFDYDNADIYFSNSKDEKTYKISEDFEKLYFTHKAFESVYKYRTAPAIKITSDNEEIKYSLNSEWNYKKLDGVYYSSKESSENNDTHNLNTERLITLTYSIEPLSVKYELLKDSELFDTGTLQDNTFKTPDSDGNYSLHIKSAYNDDTNGFKGTIESIVNFTLDLPAQFSIDKESIYQGDILRLYVKNLNTDEVPYIDQSIFSRFSFFEDKDGKSYGYIPISYNVKEGKHNISYGINDKVAGTFTIDILPRDFHIQHLKIDTSVSESTRNDSAYEQFNKHFTPKRLESNSSPYFEKAFILPTKGRLSTEYGETRHVNGSPTSYRHSGLDIAAPSGTKVLASNRGMVKLSMNLTLTGNTILIDHGSGFFSVYYHLKDRFVKEGKMVEIGQEIGTVGSTGFSTGPHLHFIISYYNQNLEPGYFIYNKPVTYNNYKTLFK